MAAGADLLSDLGSVVGPGRVRGHPHHLSLYGRDASESVGEAVAVVFPETTEEVAAVVRVARRHGVPVVARGSGTGVSGGAVPAVPAVVLSTTRMDRIFGVSAADRTAWVGAGVLNLDLTRSVVHLGLQFAPDPSSYAASTIGGNVITNAGGIHCLAEGSTAAHVLAVEFVTAAGEILIAGGAGPDPSGLDVRGLLIGSEGTLGIVTRCLVRLVEVPPAVRTFSLSFPTLEQAAAATAGIIAAGLVPAALELMERAQLSLVEGFSLGGIPDATQLIAEVSGHPIAVEAEAALILRVVREHGVIEVRMAATTEERDRLWAGRRASFSAIGRVALDHRDHDPVVPRDRLVEMVEEVRRIATRHGFNVYTAIHAGDGNIHPKLTFDGSDPAVMAEVDAASWEIAQEAVRLGGVISGEHGVGAEKRRMMTLLWSPDDLAAMEALRRAFDPTGALNPSKIMPDQVDR
jgi:glycolate oxidase subunit GlcD